MVYALLMLVFGIVWAVACVWIERLVRGRKAAQPTTVAEGDWLVQTDPARGWWWVTSAGDFMSRRSGWEGPLDADPRLDGEVKNLLTELPSAVYRRFPTRAWRVKRA